MAIAARLAKPIPAKPAMVTATDGVYTDKVRINWAVSNGATYYEVFRNTSNLPGGAWRLGSPSVSPYDDTSATVDITYWYFVKACNSAGCSVFSVSDRGYRAALTSHIISGSTGVGGVTLSYTDDTLRMAKSDSAGNYQFTVPYGWSGTVSTSKPGYRFTPAYRAYISVTADQTGQNYTAHALVTKSYRSVAYQDGWVLESSEFTTVGGSVNSGSSRFYLGDNAGNKQYRTVLSFNTLLPSNAVITSVKLKFRSAGQVGTNPFSSTGNYIRADIRKGAFNGNSALEPADFQAAASKSSVLSYTSTLVGGWYSRNLASANFAYVNRTGLTQFRLRFSTDDNNNRIADYLTFYSGNAATASYRPVLIIQYYLP